MGVDRVLATYNSNPIPGGIRFDSATMNLADVIESPESISHAVILLGITKPDTVAADRTLSEELNVSSVKRVIDQLAKWSIKPVYTSTESVFDGEKGNYVETDQANPVLTYGRQKVQIEEYLQANHPESIIARLALVLGADPKEGTQLTQWVEAIGRQETINCAHDSFSSPVFIGDVSKAIARLIDLNLSGIFHVSSRSSVSRLEMFQSLLAEMQRLRAVEADVVSCSINDFDLQEKRPHNVSMNPDKLIGATGIKIQSIEDICRKVLDSMRNVI